MKSVPKIPSLKEPPARKSFFFKYHDFVAVRCELPEPIRPVIRFAYHTGVRRGEPLLIRWPQVDFSERIVRLEPGETKNDEPRHVPLFGEL